MVVRDLQDADGQPPPCEAASGRVVVVAYELEGTAMADVADLLGIPVNTAWNRLRLALKDLRAAWRRAVRGRR